MKRRTLLIVLAVCGLCAACATPATLYGPASSANMIGYSEYRIEPGRFRVTFRGGPGATAETVGDYALLRAADLALAEGYDWFRVASRDLTQASGGAGPRVSLGAGSGGYGRRSGVSVGLGTSFNLGGGPALTATLEVVMGRGPTPRDAEAYDAREVRRNLGPRAGVRAEV